MRINRSSSSTAICCSTGVLVLLVVCTLLFSSSVALPANRRSLGFVDRLARANPFRALANIVGRKLTVDLYYPPATSQQQHQFLLRPKPQAHVYAKPSPTPTRSHYTKMPALPPVFYMPQAVNAQSSPPGYMLHGVSYQVPYMPALQKFQNSQPLQQVVQTSVPAGHNNYIQQKPQMSLAPVVPQTGILLSEQHDQYPQLQNIQQQQFTSNNQAESSRHHYHYSIPPGDSTVTVPTMNDALPSASQQQSLPNLPQLYKNVQMQIDGYEDASSSDDMLKIFVIRPKDLEKLKHSSEKEREELVKGYSMKYIDVEQGAKELTLASSQQDKEAANQLDDPSQQSSCIEPLCDPFLRKLIPELISSSSFYQNGNAEDDPIVIVKNNSETFFSGVNPLLGNHRLEEKNDHEESSEFTVVRAVEEENGENAVEILQGQDSILKPQRIKVHFPRRKFLSSKLNSSSLTKFEPNTHNDEESRSRDEGASEISSHSLVPKPRNFDGEQRSYPYYRYGSKQVTEQRIVRGSSDKSSKMMHYTAGVLFNNNSKAY